MFKLLSEPNALSDKSFIKVEIRGNGGNGYVFCFTDQLLNFIFIMVKVTKHIYLLKHLTGKIIWLRGVSTGDINRFK